MTNKLITLTLLLMLSVKAPAYFETFGELVEACKIDYKSSMPMNKDYDDISKEEFDYLGDPQTQFNKGFMRGCCH